MSGRELYEAIHGGRQFDRLPLQAVGAWGETVDRWHEEGLPDDRDHNVVVGLASDDAIHPPLNLNMVPEFEIHVLDVGDRHVKLVDEFGVTKMMMRRDYDRCEGKMRGAGQTSGMSHWVDFPVKTLADWKGIYEKRFEHTLSGRLPEDWSERKPRFVQAAETRWVSCFTFPFGGFFSALRQLMGLQGAVFAIADAPDLVRTIVSDLCDFYCAAYSEFTSDGVRVDQLTCFEDMCGTKGPIIGPAMFREFIAPGYRRFVGALKEMGVRQILIDTDGNAWDILKEFADCGVTGVHPCEVQSEMDAEKLRRAFPTLSLNGGIDKRALTKGPAEIDAELERRFATAWKHGRYTPSLDHGAPPDIPWANFAHYAQRCRELASRAR